MARSTCAAAECLHLPGKAEGKRLLLAELEKPTSTQVQLIALNSLRHIGAIHEIPAATLQNLGGCGKDRDEGCYIKRVIDRTKAGE